MTHATVTKPKVHRLRVSPERSVYFVGDMSFDEVDRDLAYIDQQIATWLAWRGYVAENGERKQES